MWNGYFRRRKAREAKRNLVKNNKIALRLIHQDKLMVAYEEAFTKVYGYKPDVSISTGWYRVMGRGFHTSFREPQLILQTAILEARANEQLCTLSDM